MQVIKFRRIGVDLPAPAFAVVRVAQLSGGEVDILRLLASRGETNKLIAFQLKLAESTIKDRISQLLAGLQLNNRTELALWAIRHPEALDTSGWVELNPTPAFM